MGKKNLRNLLSRARSGGARQSNGDEKAGEGLRDEVRRLRESVKTLRILNELAVAMGTSADPEGAVEKLVESSMRAVDAEQATVTLLEKSDNAPMETQLRVVRSSVQHQSYHIAESLLGWMLLHKDTLLIDDPQHDERFRGLSWDESIRNVICLPLMLKSELIGVLTIYNKKGQTAFTEDDEQLLSIIGAQSAQILDNARLAKEKGRMEEQLALAFDIPRNLLPDSPPILDGYDVAGSSKPAQSVGGDYFDFITVDEKRLAICLGDVSGKGLPASLLMANVQATLRGQTLVEAPANERIERANKLLCRCTDDERFVTLFYGVLDTGSNELTYCSAGHERPYLFSSDGTSRRLETGGLALGVFDTVAYEQETVPLNPGDVLVVYSDGITDAINETEEPYGENRLVELIGELVNEPASVLIDRVMKSVEAFAGNAPQFDDLTLLAVRRSG
jgi:sigma-B regulation protein RsbU (phosphoserine phosphatase)